MWVFLLSSVTKQVVPTSLSSDSRSSVDAARKDFCTAINLLNEKKDVTFSLFSLPHSKTNVTE